MSVLLRKGAYYPGVTQNTVTNATSTVAAAFGTQTTVIRVGVQYDTYICLGNTVASSTVSSTATTMIIPGGGVEFFAVNPLTYLSHEYVATSGWISITELASGLPDTKD